MVDVEAGQWPGGESGFADLVHHFQRQCLLGRIFDSRHLLAFDDVCPYLAKENAVSADICLAAMPLNTVTDKAGGDGSLHENIDWRFFLQVMLIHRCCFDTAKVSKIGHSSLTADRYHTPVIDIFRMEMLKIIRELAPQLLFLAGDVLKDQGQHVFPAT